MAKKKSIFEGSLKKEGVDSSGHDHEEPDENKESSEDLKEEMDLGDADEDVYSEEGREELEEDDEISPGEQGFMQGAEGTGHKQKKHPHKEHKRKGD